MASVGSELLAEDFLAEVKLSTSSNTKLILKLVRIMCRQLILPNKTKIKLFRDSASSQILENIFETNLELSL